MLSDGPIKKCTKVKEIKAYWVPPSQITEIELPDSMANLSQLGDFNPNNPLHLGYLIITECEDIYIFTDDDVYQDWIQVIKKI